MTEIRFYHLQQDTTTKAVPRILGTALGRGMRVLLKLPDEARVAFYDDWLWRFQPDSFLPHGREGDPNGEIQPVWLSTADEAPNKATMAMVVEGAALPSVDEFDLICLIFDAENVERLESARKLWSELKKGAGLTLTYWKQQDNGAWAKQDI